MINLFGAGKFMIYLLITHSDSSHNEAKIANNQSVIMTCARSVNELHNYSDIH